MADALNTSAAEWVPLDRIHPWDKNPRRNEGAVKPVASSLSRWGWAEVIVAQRGSGRIISGHTRWKAAKELGEAVVPVRFVDVADQDVEALSLALNKLGEIAEWDEALLAEILQDFDLADAAIAGFSDKEVSELLASLQKTITFLGDPDEVPEAPEEPITKPGDLWILGRHRLLCGDSRRPEDLKRLMAGQKADMVFTDPPYNVAYVGKTKDALRIENDSMDDAEFFQFLLKAYEGMLTHTEPGGAIYVCHADSEGANFRKALVEAGWLLKQCLVWVKHSIVMGRQDYHWQHEPILYGWAPGSAHKWHGDRKQSTVWNFDRPNRNGEHPTMKPVELVERALTNSSTPGDKVLDPFGGSGTTLVACEKMGRSAFLIELDPRYCDVIIRRWEQFTGNTAHLACP
jgi:DNA modification methylase